MLIVYLIILLFLGFVMIKLYNMEVDKGRSESYVRAGLEYNVGKRIYKIPNMPVSGVAKMLDEEFLLLLRRLYQKTSKTLEELNIEAWMSGGTLMGFMKHKTFMPWDDDIDCHTDINNKDKFFDMNIINKFKEDGMELLFMLGMTPEYTFYKGGVRVKLKEYDNPVMDIFFVKKVGDKIRKIENWNKDVLTFNEKEIWPIEQIYPIRKEVIDDMNVKIPRDPENVLKKQYGPKVMDEIYCNGINHSIAYDLLKIIWIKP